MDKHNFKPSKALSQNFINDANILRKIVKYSGISKAHGVLEIGPGFGALTKELAAAAGHVTAVELDKRLIDGLSRAVAGYSNVTVIQGDILKTDIADTVSNTLPEEQRCVCANLPYNITTPVITRLTQADIFEHITVMVQKEVAMRICAAPGSPQYGAFSVFSRFYATPEFFFDIPPECFTPRPKVTSGVIKMTLRKERFLSGDDEKAFFRTVKAAFGRRRKTLVNALHAVYKSTHSKDAIIKAVKDCGFDLNIRGEVLGIEDFIKLTECMMKYSSENT